MINYKQLAIDLIAIQAEAVGRGTELLERAKKGEFDVRVKQCFEEDIKRNRPREDRDLYGQAARDAALGRKVREIADNSVQKLASCCDMAALMNCKVIAYNEIMRAVDNG